jgi:hypothetical protein
MVLAPASNGAVLGARVQFYRLESVLETANQATVPVLVSGASDRESALKVRSASAPEALAWTALTALNPELILEPSDQVGSGLGLASALSSKRQFFQVVPALRISQRQAQ